MFRYLATTYSSDANNVASDLEPTIPHQLPFSHRSAGSHSIPTINPAAPIAKALALTSPVGFGAAPALLEADVTPMLPAAMTGLEPPPDAPPSPPPWPPPAPLFSPPPWATPDADAAAVKAALAAALATAVAEGLKLALAWRGMRSRLRGMS